MGRGLKKEIFPPARSVAPPRHLSKTNVALSMPPSQSADDPQAKAGIGTLLSPFVALYHAPALIVLKWAIHSAGADSGVSASLSRLASLGG